MQRSAFVPAVLVAGTLSACGHMHAMVDMVRGDRSDPARFRVDAAALPGVYYLESVGQEDARKDVTPEDGKRQELWVVADDKVTIFRPELGDGNCPAARPFHIEGRDQLVLAASDGCAAESWRVLGQRAEDADRRVPAALTVALPRTVDGVSYEVATLAKADPARLTESLFSWELPPRQAPAAVLSLFPSEVSEAAMQAAQASFRPLVGAATLELKQPLEAAMTETGDGVKVVMLQHGRVSDELTDWDEHGARCYLLLGFGTDVAAAGLKRQVASAQLAAPRRQNGLWVAQAAATGAAAREESTENPRRDNQVRFTFQGDPGLSLYCEKPRAQGPLTLSDVREALGSVVTL